MPKTLSIELRGDRQTAKWIQMDHLNRLLAVLEETNKQNLPVYSLRKNFYTPEGALLGEVYLQTVYGARTAVITGAKVERHERAPEEREELLTRIVPCFVVTAEQGDSEILGYVVCSSGSFLPPYTWFANTMGEAVSIDGFVANGHPEYDEELALADFAPLANAGDTNLVYLAPTGGAPAESRYTYGPETNEGSCSETFGGVYFHDYVDATWVYSAAMSDNPISGSTEYRFDYLFDGTSIGWYSDGTDCSGGVYSVIVGSFGCTPVTSACYDGLATFKNQTFTPVYSSNDTTVSFDNYSRYYVRSEELVYGLAAESIRTNGALDDAVYLLDKWALDRTTYTWNAQPMPSPYNGEPTSNVPCSGCISIDQTWSTELLLVVDSGESESLTSLFGWGDHFKHGVMALGCGLVYHKPSEDAVPVVLAAVMAGETTAGGGGEYSTLACVYSGPDATELQGSTSFPLVVDGSDRYAIPPVTLPEGVSGRIRGHVFLGRLRTTQTKEITAA